MKNLYNGGRPDLNYPGTIVNSSVSPIATDDCASGSYLGSLPEF